MLDDLALFVAIVEAGSLNAAAEKEGLPTATVTRRLQRLEASLGYRLLHRSARRTQPTAEGAQYYEQCRPLVQALRQATLRLDATLGAIEIGRADYRALLDAALGAGVASAGGSAAPPESSGDFFAIERGAPLPTDEASTVSAPISGCFIAQLLGHTS